MKHALLLFARLILLVFALYAVSNALKELLLREDELLDTALLVLSNVLIAALCWSLGCWRPRATPDLDSDLPPGSFRPGVRTHEPGDGLGHPEHHNN